MNAFCRSSQYCKYYSKYHLIYFKSNHSFKNIFFWFDNNLCKQENDENEENIRNWQDIWRTVEHQMLNINKSNGNKIKKKKFIVLLK